MYSKNKYKDYLLFLVDILLLPSSISAGESECCQITAKKTVDKAYSILHFISFHGKSTLICVVKNGFSCVDS